MDDPVPVDCGLAADDFVDHFRIIRRLGEGGMAVVYLARDTSLGRKVALKVVRPKVLASPQEVERFLFEARATARFNHPHIITIHAVGEAGGRPYVALEYVPGQALQDRIDHDRPAYQEATRIGLAVAEALKAAHSEGILHRDLKPANVMLGQDGRIRVLDFGLARAFQGPEAGRNTMGGEDLERSRIDDPFVSQSGGVRGTPAYMAPEQWADEELTWAIDIWALGVILYELVSGQTPYRGAGAVDLGIKVLGKDPVPPPECETALPAELEQVILDCLTKDPSRRPSAEDVVERLRQILYHERENISSEETPFRGLLPFDERHRHFFFGRESEIAAFAERLRIQPILPVIGPSAAGKSSFVQAGVIPRLRERGRLVVLQMRPGHDPFVTLASRVAAARGQGSTDVTAFGATPGPGVGGGGSRDDEVDRLASQLRSSPHLLNLVLHKLAESRRSSVLLFVDQLEELVTLERDPEERRTFMQALCAAADDPQLAVRVVFTLREEFLSRLADSAGVREALSRITVLRSPGPEALREILSRPVEAVGYSFGDDELVSEMVSEVQGEASCLPLLQFAGQILWERRDRAQRVLQRSVYEAMGGVAGALAQHADGVLAGLSVEEVRLARTMLLRLVTPEGTRKSMARPALIEGLPPGADEVLRRLITARLLTGKQSVEEGVAELELVHESLMVAWGRLARWIDESREELVFLGEVSQAAELWERRGCRDEEVWQGDALREAQRAASNCTSVLSGRVRRFLAAGQAKESQVTVRKRVIIGGVIAVLLIIAFALTGAVIDSNLQAAEAELARDRAQNAEQTARESLARSLADKAAVTEPVHESTLYALASLGESENPDARGVLAGLINQPRPVLEWQSRPGTNCVDLAFDAEGNVLACANDNAGVFLWDAGTGKELAHWTDEDARVFQVAFGPDGETVALGYFGGTVRIVERETGHELLRYAGQRGVVIELRYSADGTRLASASVDGSTVLLDPEDGTEVARLQGQCPQAYAVDISPSGGKVATGCGGGDVLVWSPSSDEEIRRWPAHAKDVSGLRFLSEEVLLSSSDDGTMVLWDLTTGDEIRRYDGCESRAGALEMVPGGEAVYMACYDGTIQFWDIDGAEQPAVVESHTGGMLSVALSAGGQRMATSSTDGTVILWDPSTHEEQARLSGHAGTIAALAFSPSGDRIVSADSVGTMRLWEASSGKELGTARSMTVIGTIFTPDGHRLVGGGMKGDLSIVDAETGELVHELVGPGGKPDKESKEQSCWPLGFDEAGERLLSTCGYGPVRLWDLESGALVQTLTSPLPEQRFIAATADGATLASVGRDHEVHLWERGGSLVHQRSVAGGVYDIYVGEFSRDGELLAVANKAGRVKVWRTATGEQVAALEGHGATVTTLSFSADGSMLATGSADKTVRIWDTATWAEKSQLQHGQQVMALAFSPSGPLVATAATDQTVRYWSLDADRPSPVLQGHSAIVAGVAFVADGQELRSLGHDSVALSWDLDHGRVTDRTELPAKVPRPLGFRDEGRQVVALSGERAVELWHLGSGAQLARCEGGEDGKITSVTYRPGGELVAWSDPEHGIWICHIEEGRARKLDVQLGLPGFFWPYSAALSHDEKLLAVGDAGGDVHVIDTESGELAYYASGQIARGLAFSPDSQLLAKVHGDGSIKVLGLPHETGAGGAAPSPGDVQRLREVASMEGHDNIAWMVTFSPDGRMLATGGSDGYVRIWDVGSYRELARLPGYGRSAGLEFSPDASLLATPQADNAVRLWDMDVLRLPVEELMERVTVESGLLWDGQQVVVEPERLTPRFEFDLP